MYPKAYRWVAEMEEVAEFLGPEDPAAAIIKANAEIFSRLAADRNGDRKLEQILDAILEEASARTKAG
jgi:hypothetical protein